MAKNPAAAIAIPFSDLRPLFGRAADDASVTEVLARAGKVTWTKPDGGSRYAVAKQAGFDLLVEKPEGAKRGSPMVVQTIFLYAEEQSGHRGFTAPPYGLAFTSRAALLKAMPAPERTWLIGKGKVPVTSAKASHDRWLIDGLYVSADYDQELNVRSIDISLPDA